MNSYSRIIHFASRNVPVALLFIGCLFNNPTLAAAVLQDETSHVASKDQYAHQQTYGHYSASLMSEEDREFAIRQEYCPVTFLRFINMNVGGIRIRVKGRDVIVACGSARDVLLKSPDKYLEILDKWEAERKVLSGIREAMEPLSEADRALAEAQVICPVTEVRLGSMGMGTPIKLEIEGRTVFICCEGCRDSWVNEPDKFFKILDDYLSGKTKQPELTDAEKDEIRKAMEPLSEADRALAEAQVICPVAEVRLGSMGMGTPIKLEIEGRTVFICCEGCRYCMVNDPTRYFKILDDYLSGKTKSQDSDVPTPISPADDDDELPQMKLPGMELPKMELPKGEE